MTTNHENDAATDDLMDTFDDIDDVEDLEELESPIGDAARWRPTRSRAVRSR